MYDELYDSSEMFGEDLYEDQVGSDKFPEPDEIFEDTAALDDSLFVNDMFKIEEVEEFDDIDEYDDSLFDDPSELDGMTDVYTFDEFTDDVLFELTKDPPNDSYDDFSEVDDDGYSDGPRDKDDDDGIEFSEDDDGDELRPYDEGEDAPDEIYDIFEEQASDGAPDFFPAAEAPREYDAFEERVMEVAPDFYSDGRYYQQGINEFGYEGTCGPTSQANAVNFLLGNNNLTENKVLTIARDNVPPLCATNGEPAECGGTTTRQFMQLYDRVNEQVGDRIQTELYEYDNALSLEEMADRLDNGSVLNVAVDSSTLWDQPKPFGFGGSSYSDHWITVTGAERDSRGRVTGFNIIDSGGGVSYVDADKYERMCFGSFGNKVKDPTMIVVSRK